MKQLKKLLFSLFIITFSSQLLGQQLSENDIIGNWKVVDSQIMQEIKMPNGDNENFQIMMEQLKNGFVNTIFTISDNGEFKIKFSDKIPVFMKDLEFLNNKKWKIKNNRKIAIGTEEDNYSLMGITVINKQNKKYFILDESPIILEVENINN